MRNVFGRVKVPDKKPLRIASFRGINQSVPDEMLYSSLSSNSVACYTPRGKNFWIERGALRPRNNYEQVFTATVTADINDGYTYYVKSLYMYASKSEDAAPVMLAGVDAWTGGAHHHYALAQRTLGAMDKWAIVKTGASSIFGSGKDLYFTNANFSFVNFTGNFLGAKTDDSATVMCNGADMPVAYVGAGGGSLYELRSNSWADVTVTSGTDTLTLAGLATNGNAIQFFSRTKQMPGGLTAGTTYYVVNASSPTFKVAATVGGAEIDITSDGANVMARLTSAATADAPIGDQIFVHGDRIWLSVGNILYHSNKFIADAQGEDGYAHCRDWTTTIQAGEIPVLTFDGDQVTGSVEFRGSPIVSKENSIWRITGKDAPYGVEQVFSSRGTISRNSICEYLGNLIYAVPEGIMSFNGTTSSAFITDEIRDIWLPNNEDCICKVAGDVLYIYGNMTDPITGVDGKGLLAVHMPTKNICYWDMAMGVNTLSVDCALDSWYTTLMTGVVRPQFWFVKNDLIYRVSDDPPEIAEAMTYVVPMYDYGTNVHIKNVSRIAFTGKGGNLLVTPIVDNNHKSAKTIVLPKEVDITRPTQVSIFGIMLGWLFQNISGSTPEVTMQGQEYTMGV